MTKSASDWANEMADLRRIKPRPINKLYGKNGPTAEQAKQHAADMKAWNTLYRKASKEQKAALIRDNAAYQLRSKSDTNPIRRGYSQATLLGNIAELVAKHGRAQAIAIAMKSARAAWRTKHKTAKFPDYLTGAKNPIKPSHKVAKVSPKKAVTRTVAKHEYPYYVQMMRGAAWKSIAGFDDYDDAVNFAKMQHSTHRGKWRVVKK